MESNRKQQECVPVISATDAFRLLQVKHILPHRTTVNIEGTVTAFSEIIRINKDGVFMIELQGRSTVVVKQTQFHKWHEQLEVGETFVFTNLRPTTLSGSHRSEQRVFVPWTGSKFFPPSDDITHLSLQEWLGTLGVSLPEEEEHYDADWSEQDVEIGASATLTFYQGVVTDTRQAEFGVFELDNKTRLFLCYLPRFQHPKELAVGDCVTLYNVHQSLCLKTQNKRLYCCVRSTIHVAHTEKPPEEKDAADDGSAMDNSPPVTLLQHYAFTQTDLLPLLQLYQQVCQAMGHQHNHLKSEKKNRVRRVLQHLVGSLCTPDKQAARNYILEFCQHRVFCPLDNTMDESGDGVPQLTFLTQLAQDVTTGETNSDVPSDGISSPASSDQETVWKFHMKTVNQPLLGWLNVNPVTRHLQLSDSQGAMDVVIISSQLMSATPPHQCHTQCDCSFTVEGEQPRCPKVHPCCLGQLVVVKACMVVTETFYIENYCRNSSQKQSSKTLSYLLLTTQDCVAVKMGDSQGKANESKNDVSGRKHDSKAFSSRYVPEPHRRLVYITEKCSLSARTTSSESPSSLQFCAEGFLVTPKDDNDKSRSISPQDNAKVSCDTRAAAKKRGHVSETSDQPKPVGEGQSSSNKSVVDSTKVSCDTTAPAKRKCHVSEISDRPQSIGEDQSGSNRSVAASSASCELVPSPSCPLPQSLQLDRPLSLVFEEDSCQWFDLIHPPGLYRFVGMEESDPLQWQVVNANLQAAMERTGTPMEVKVSASAVMDRLFMNCSDRGQVLTIPSLQSALSNGSSGQLQSFRGVVNWRKLLLSQFPEFRTARTVGTFATGEEREAQTMTLSSFLGQRSVCVNVRDVSDPSVTTSVYLNFSRQVYPLGLLPGTVVDFHRLERKMSKAGKTYFSFLPVSALSIQCGPSPATAHNRPAFYGHGSGDRNHPPSWDEVPVQRLVDLWQQPAPHDVFVTMGHVCQFFRLSLKSLCVHCGSLFYSDGCSAAACTNTHLSILLPRISVLVEDGSCQALVNINKSCLPDVARKLLRMSENQWLLLEKTLQQQGELFLQKFGCSGGTAAEDLMSLLCGHNRIKRPCWLMLRRPMYSKAKKKGVAALEALTVDDLVTRHINTGEETIETLCLPYLKLDCLDIKEVD